MGPRLTGRKSSLLRKKGDLPTPKIESKDTIEVGGMEGEVQKESVEVEAVEEVVEKVEPKQEQPKKSEEVFLFALRRCRYTSGGKIVTAESGEQVVNPTEKDLQDLIEHGCVETFEPSQVQALLSLRDKNPDAKKRLAKAVGII